MTTATNLPSSGTNDAANASQTGLFWNLKFPARPMMAEICHWESATVAYVRWLEQGANGFNVAEKA